MSSLPLLLVGGSGVIGRQTARYLREAHPDVPLLIGGRDQARAKAAASEIGGAEGVTVDLTVDDLGLGDRPVGAIAIFFKDERLASLRFAQARRVPHVSISSGVQEMGPEVAAYMHMPDAAPIVLGTEWLVGATTISALEFAKAFDRVDTIRIGALLDEQDGIGPEGDVDMERLTRILPAALTRRDGVWHWRVGADAKTSFSAADGTRVDAVAFAANDVLGLAAETGARNVTFDLATGVSSSRRRGEAMSAEILIEIAGVDHDGRPLRTRHAVVHPKGQVPLTALGVAMVLERLAGLDGKPQPRPGLYFPYQLLDRAAYLKRLGAIGGVTLALEPA
jgi:hypothetical protein